MRYTRPERDFFSGLDVLCFFCFAVHLPSSPGKVHQKVMATVHEVDVKRKRISLSLKKNPEQQGKQERQPKPQQKTQPKPQTDLNALQQAFMKNRT